MRKVIQFQVMPPDSAGNSSLVALCDDGTMWELDHATAEWAQLDGVPQDEAPEGEEAAEA